MSIKGKDLCVFVRFGGLNLKKQKGYTTAGELRFHSPPAPRGIYAMPKVAQSLFLLGSMNVYQPGIYPKDPKIFKHPGDAATPEEIYEWDKATDEFDYEGFEKHCKRVKLLVRKEFVKRTGNVWHHFGDYTDNSEVIDRHGSWVKTSIKEWQNAFGKMSVNWRMEYIFEHVKSINTVRGLVGYHNMDHCEVFFDEKI